MTAVGRTADPLALSGAVATVVLGLTAWAAAPLLLILGQGLGALAGGCDWIGAVTSIHRQPWALVNQPTIDFASRPASFGYWWGGTMLCLATAALAVPLLPRPRTLVAELATIQLSLAAAFLVAWTPLLATDAGHPGRWLQLRSVPVQGLWLLPAAAGIVSVLPTLRLLGLLAGARRRAGRGSRLLLVAVALAPPTGAWVVAAWRLSGSFVPLVEPLLGVGIMIATVLGVAVVGYGRPVVHPVATPTSAGLLAATLAAVILAAAAAGLGLPRRGAEAGGVLWGAPGATNNIRSWMEPATARVPWSDASRTGRYTAAPGGRG